MTPPIGIIMIAGAVKKEMTRPMSAGEVLSGAISELRIGATSAAPWGGMIFASKSVCRLRSWRIHRRLQIRI